MISIVTLQLIVLSIIRLKTANCRRNGTERKAKSYKKLIQPFVLNRLDEDLKVNFLLVVKAVRLVTYIWHLIWWFLKVNVRLLPRPPVQHSRISLKYARRPGLYQIIGAGRDRLEDKHMSGRSSVLGKALFFSCRGGGGLCNIRKNVGITWSVPHMFLLPVWKYSKLPEMISSLNWRKFQLWCHSPHPTHTEGLIITRTICGVCADLQPEQRQCCHENLWEGFERRATRAAPMGRDSYGTDARLSLSSRWTNFRFKRGLS